MKIFDIKSRTETFLTSQIFISFCIVFFSSIVIFQIYLGTHLSNDCYALWFNIGDFPYQASSQGRVLTGLITTFFDNIGINLVRQQRVFTGIGLVVYSIAVTCLAETIIKLKDDNSLIFRIISCLISFMIIFNFFSVDLFHYTIMMLPYSFSSLFTVLASRSVLLEQNRFGYLKAGLFLILSVTLYQSYTALFVPLALMGLMLNSNSVLSLREKLRRAFLSLTIFGTVLLIDYAYIKLIHLNFLNHLWYDARTSQTPSILKNLKYIIHIQDDLWIYSFDMIGRFLFLLFTLVFISFFLFYKTDVREKTQALLFAIFSLATFYVTLLLPHVFSGAIDISARSLYTFASIPALVVFGFIFHQRGWFEKLSLSNLGLFLAVGLFLLLQIKTINMFGTEGLIINREDDFHARKIVDSITDYENRSGNMVSALYFKNDPHVRRCYRDGCYVHAKAMAVYWSRSGSLRISTGRDFKTSEMDANDFARLFESKDWTDFVPQEQIKFEGDKAYIVVF